MEINFVGCVKKRFIGPPRIELGNRPYQERGIPFTYSPKETRQKHLKTKKEKWI